MKNLLLLLSIFLCIFYVNAIYFHLYQDEKKCFYDEYYTDTVIIYYLYYAKIYIFTITH